MAMAAWWGMLATALNLLPFGQLDGGHIVYALFGSGAAKISMATLAVTLLLTVRSMSWIAMTIMMLVMAFFLGFKHPPIGDEDEPLEHRAQGARRSAPSSSSSSASRRYRLSRSLEIGDAL